MEIVSVSMVFPIMIKDLVKYRNKSETFRRRKVGPWLDLGGSCCWTLLLDLGGGRVGLVVRALAFHQCVPGSISALGVICGLSLLVLYSVMRGFLRVLRFSPLIKNHHLNWLDLWIIIINSDLGNVDLISSRIVKRIWSCSYANLRYRNNNIIGFELEIERAHSMVATTRDLWRN